MEIPFVTNTRSAWIFMEKIPTGKSLITGTVEANEIRGRWKQANLALNLVTNQQSWTRTVTFPAVFSFLVSDSNMYGFLDLQIMKDRAVFHLQRIHKYQNNIKWLFIGFYNFLDHCTSWLILKNLEKENQFDYKSLDSPWLIECKIYIMKILHYKFSLDFH